MMRNALRTGYRSLFWLVLLAAGILIIGILDGCSNNRSKYLERVKQLEEEQYAEGELPAERINRLNEEIEALEEEVERTIDAQRDLGVYHKMLATTFMDARMFGPALEHFQQAIEISSGNHVLPYNAGICAAQLAKVTADSTLHQELLYQAEQYYLISLRMKSTYVDAMYALAILYIYELERSYDAEPLLDAILEIQSSHTGAMFLRARQYAQEDEVEKAVELYDRIIELNPSEEEVFNARENRSLLLGEYYE